MKQFTIYPAIDLRHGRVVRLQQGDPEMETVFSEDPLEAGERWLAAGAAWLHVVNLDGAFAEEGAANWQSLAKLSRLPVNLQFGGGLRSLTDMQRAVDCGVNRFILGTVAIEDPDLVSAAIDRFGPTVVAVGIDARDGRVKTRGWQHDGQLSPAVLASRMKARGVETLIYTDINRDGVLTGVNAAATVALAQASGLNVIASGGVATLADVSRCLAYAGQGVAGVITGRALYDGRLDLKAALATVSDTISPTNIKEQ